MMFKKKANKITCFCLSLILVFQQAGLAQVAGTIDLSGYFKQLQQTITLDRFRPLHLRYLQYLPEDNSFKLLLDKGDSENRTVSLKGNGPFSKETVSTLLNYFFIGLSLPNDSFWVNLRPDSPEKIIDPFLAQTDIGRIMLETDVQLKKDTSLATSPDTPEGREYWDKLYQKANELLGYDNITIPTLVRPWIVPDEIIVRETNTSAYVYKATLKVMLEEDYLKGTVPNSSLLKKGTVPNQVYEFNDPRLKQLNEYSAQLIRELIIPKLTKEINTSKRYASLRQVYYSLILAQWFKARNRTVSPEQDRFPLGKRSFLSLIDSQDLTNLSSKAPYSKETYFQQYQHSFKQGEYHFSEPVSTIMGRVVRSYMSGGIAWQGIAQAAAAIPNIGKGELPQAIASLPENIAISATGTPGGFNIEAKSKVVSSPVEEPSEVSSEELNAYIKVLYSNPDEAVEALCKIKLAPEQEALVLPLLRDKDLHTAMAEDSGADIADALAMVLGNTGGRRIANFLIAFLEEESGENKERAPAEAVRAAISALGIMAERGEERKTLAPAIKVIKEFVQVIGGNIPETAAWALGEIGNKEAERAIVDLSKGILTEEIRASLKRALVRIQESKLKSKNISLQEDAIKVLSGLKDSQAVSLLATALEDKYPPLLEMTAQALGDTGNAEAIPLLLQLLDRVLQEDLLLSVGAHAVRSLRRLGWAPTSEREEISVLIVNRNWDGLEERARREPGLFIRLLDDAYARIRGVASDTLGIVDQEEAVESLIRVMQSDPVWFVRQNAAASLGRITIKDEDKIRKTIASLKEVSGNNQENEHVCANAKRLLFKMSIQDLKYPDRDIKLEAIETLRALKDPAAIPYLEALALGDEVEGVQSAAYVVAYELKELSTKAGRKSSTSVVSLPKIASSPISEEEKVKRYETILNTPGLSFDVYSHTTWALRKIAQDRPDLAAQVMQVLENVLRNPELSLDAYASTVRVLREIAQDRPKGIVGDQVEKFYSARSPEKTSGGGTASPVNADAIAQVQRLSLWMQDSYQRIKDLYLPQAGTSQAALASGKSDEEIRQELEEDIYKPLFASLKATHELIQQGQIRPDVRLRISDTDAPAYVPVDLGRPLRVAFLPMKGNPWQTGHLFVIFEAIARQKLDKVVVMIDNSDPIRKADLSSLTIREPISQMILRELGSFVQYTPLPKEREELFTADGETVVFKFIELNKDIDMDVYYMAGSDHRYWEIKKKHPETKQEIILPDVTKKLFERQRDGLYGYQQGLSPHLSILFTERIGEPLTEADLQDLRAKSGMTIEKIFQPMDTSATRIRKEQHWWTAPWYSYLFARAFKFWGFEQVGEEVVSVELIALAEQALLAASDTEYVVKKSEVSAKLREAYGPAMSSFDGYIMKKIIKESKEPVIQQRLAEIRSLIFARGEEIAKSTLSTSSPVSREERIKELISLLESPNSATRREAASALGRMKAEEAVIPLRDKLNDKAIQLVVAMALGRIGSSQAVKELTTFFELTNEYMRVVAVRALGITGSTLAIPTLEKASRDKSKKVHRAAAEVLKKIEETNKGDKGSSPSAASPVGQEEEIKKIIAQLGHEAPFVRKVAAERLGKIGKEEGLPEAVISALAKRLNDNDESVRTAAILAFEGIKTPNRAIPSLLRRLQTAKSRIARESSAEALEFMVARLEAGQLNALDIKQLIEGVIPATQDESVNVQSAAVAVLEALAENPVIPWEELIRDEPGIKETVAELARGAKIEDAPLSGRLYWAFQPIQERINKAQGPGPNAASPISLAGLQAKKRRLVQKLDELNEQLDKLSKEIAGWDNNVWADRGEDYSRKKGDLKFRDAASRDKEMITLERQAIEAQIAAINEQISRIKARRNQSHPGAASPVDRTVLEAPGGIDLRNLPIVTQVFTNLSANIRLNSQELSRFASLNLRTEELEMEKLLSAELIPSVERLKEYLQASCYQGAISENRDKAMSLIAQILRLEETHSLATEPTLRDILVVLEASQNPAQLKEVFLGQPS